MDDHRIPLLRHLFPNRRRRAAAHEAGHTVAAWLDPTVRQVTKVEANRAGNGRTLYVTTDVPKESESERLWLWSRTATALAGIAGEYVALGSFTTDGCESDFAAAQDYAERITEGRVAGDEPLTGSPWGEAPYRTRFSVERSFETKLRTGERLVIEHAFRHAVRMILLAPDRCTTLIRELTKHDALYHADIERILGPRPWTRHR